MVNKKVREQLAEMLDGRQYRSETNEAILDFATKNDLVIVFGASDDLIEFRGAIDDEQSAWNGDDHYFDNEGDFIDSEDVDDYDGELNVITSKWCKLELPDVSWSYSTEIPHSTFQIKEGDDVYCVGIVFSIHNLK